MPVKSVTDVHRTLLLAPVAFVLLAMLGVHNTIGGWLSPAGRPAPAPRPGVVSAANPVVAAPTYAMATLVAAVKEPPTVVPTPTAPLSIDAALVPSPTPIPSPTPLPPTSTAVPPTATVAPTNTPPTTATARPAAAGPRRIGTEPLPKVNARSYVIVDGDSGEILAEHNARMRVAPASTTKIVTALVALRRNGLAETVTARFDQSELIDSTLMGLRQGDVLSLEDLLFGLMLPSGNDAALAVANHVSGSKMAFVAQMNQLTAELGLKDSQWKNPHGLDEVGHYSSAYDMVQFARYGMPDPRFHALAATRVRTVKPGGRSYDVYNLNRLIGNLPGADGVKIGYTEEAGRTMVASVTRNGKRIYVGAFNINDQMGDTRPLVDWAFRNFSWG